MNTRVVTLRTLVIAACSIALGAACSSSDAASKPQPTSTTSAAEKPNQIPFEVGVPVGLPRGWQVQITKVERPYSNPQLDALGDGREYVAVDISMDNRGASTQTVNAEKLFQIGDTTGKLDAVVTSTGLDGNYPPNTKRSGRLVFDVPKKAELRMVMDGPQIGTQIAIFTIDPPKVGPGD